MNSFVNGKEIFLPYRLVCYVDTIDRYEGMAITLSDAASRSHEIALFAAVAKEMAHACGMEPWPRGDFIPRFATLFTMGGSGDFVPCAIFKQENNGDTFMVTTQHCLNTQHAHQMFVAADEEQYYGNGSHFGFGHFKKYRIFKAK